MQGGGRTGHRAGRGVGVGLQVACVGEQGGKVQRGGQGAYVFKGWGAGAEGGALVGERAGRR